MHPHGSPHPQVSYQHRTVANGGLSAWMHLLYAIGGVLTCGLLWAVWAAHWWFAQSRSRTTTTVMQAYHQPGPHP
ncbi:hypothetical protein JNW90_01230 [Micromonospora sp. STR1s_5]|nr:hypothetical protein [Micromonospora sp. STR1s_5]